MERFRFSRRARARRLSVVYRALCCRTARIGVAKDFVKVGDVIEARGYVTKVEVQRTVDTEPISLSLKPTMPKGVSGRVIDGELIVSASGKRQPWSDYGHHKCLGPDYQDFHAR